jgi:hypothetical protein
MESNVERYGRLAFEAYGKSTGGRTYDGRPIPKWHELPENIREAWCAAGAVVASDVMQAVTVRLRGLVR